VASLTDALDGWLARRNKSESTFGKLMDPLADKLLVVAAIVALVALNRLSAVVAMVIIAREFAVTGLRQLAMESGHVIPASIWGKLNGAGHRGLGRRLLLQLPQPDSGAGLEPLARRDVMR
jgi:CDP-diacylglycerol--glycerol-3-phosphate 3-phosphatidyltransferase